MSISNRSLRPGSVHKNRRRRVERACEFWTRRLIDLSRRNNLLYFRPLKTGTWELEGPSEKTLSDLFGGKGVSLERLIRNQYMDAEEYSEKEQEALRRLTAIRRRALSNLEEKGLDTLFLAYGMATWEVGDQGRPPAAPVLLLPLEIRARSSRSPQLVFRRNGDARVNLVLLHVLNHQFGCRVDPDGLLKPVQEVDSRSQTFDPERTFQYLKRCASRVRGFTIQPRAVIGNFAFQKMAMVNDLRHHLAQLVENDLVAALAGDSRARDKLAQNVVELDPRELDAIPPQEDLLVFDADASQRLAIRQVLSGQSGVIVGPPGTGKSQTIANLIAILAAKGKRVLFVAEKRAALEVVLNRLRRVGLGHLALDLHGADLSRKEVVRRIGESLEDLRASPPVIERNLYERLRSRRQRLNEYVKALHKQRDPFGLSVYEIQGRLLHIPKSAATSIRWRDGDLEKIDRDVADEIRDLLQEAGGFEDLFRKSGVSPWENAVVPTGDAAQKVVDLVRRVHEESLPHAVAVLRRSLDSLGLHFPKTVSEARAVVDLLIRLEELLLQYSEQLFRMDLHAIERNLALGSESFFHLAWYFLTSRTFRHARKALLGVRASKADITTLLEEVKTAIRLLEKWRQYAADPSNLPKRPTELQELQEALRSLEKEIGELDRFFPDASFAALDVTELEKLLSGLHEEAAQAYRLPRLYEIEEVLKEYGVFPLVDEIRQKQIPASEWVERFDFAWLSSCLDHVRALESLLAAFSRRTHDTYVKEFQKLDHRLLGTSQAQVRRQHAERAIEAMNRYPEQADLLHREIQKRRQHLPLRKLAARAPDVLMAICPCWMASPLSVSQVLDGEKQYFDLVIFDESSQVLPEDAISSLLRAGQVVVAGDPHQLPPTPFFVTTSGDLEGEEDPLEETGGFESILDIFSTFLPAWMLRWHYRSRDERLIAFSNHHIYGDRLITFPGVGGDPCVTHVEVTPTFPWDGDGESSSAEVQRVVDLVLKHAKERPEETLGVIAMGIRHAERIQMALDEVLRDYPELEDFFSEEREERFFIKNLERVQGDERDAIILTIGYGKDRSGRLLYRFGPLNNREYGYRRLNVAITRARRRLTLVSSFSHHDMDPERPTSRGVELLRRYLAYAASGGADLQRGGLSGEALNPFEADVYDALSSRGLDLVPQWGCSGYRIDFAVKHPKDPGRFVLAIECDGATYHSTPTARDRDRLRQEHLEALGWRFHRIWSTEWFLHREEEIRRALEAYQRAVDAADRGGPGKSGNVSSRSRRSTRSQRRGPRPDIPFRSTIEEYTVAELVALVRWIESDGQLRTDEEILREMIRLLGFKRRGTRIERKIRAAIHEAHKY